MLTQRLLVTQQEFNNVVDCRRLWDDLERCLFGQHRLPICMRDAPLAGLYESGLHWLRCMLAHSISQAFDHRQAIVKTHGVPRLAPH